MTLNPYLHFNGQCEAAFRFYAECLRGEILMMLPFGDAPPGEGCGELPADWRTKIMHARLSAGGQLLMGSDSPPAYQEEAKGYSVALGVESAEEAERIFGTLAENGTVRMPLAETFWAVRFGMVVDRFGIPWMINCEKLPVT